MLDERKAAILRAVVEEYIETAQPVGSGHVAAAPGVNVSSATVRNDMAALEQEGYLHQPHTSAGRVPTEKGYRFFVDHLRRAGPARRAAGAQQVRDVLRPGPRRARADAAPTPAACCRTSPTTPPWSSARPTRRHRPLGAARRPRRHASRCSSSVLSNGVGREAHASSSTDDDRRGARRPRPPRTWPRHLVGRPPRRSPRGARRRATPPPTRSSTAAVAALRRRPEDEPEHVFVGGTSRMAAAFDAVETVREVLGILEQQYVVVTLLRDVLDRGPRTSPSAPRPGMEPLAECSLVVAPVRGRGRAGRHIGVLGPTRMNYPQALAAVAVVSKRLGRPPERGLTDRGHRLLRAARRLPRRHGRRDQAGLPPARPRAAPRRQPGDPEAEARFKEVAVAYEVLSDPERRRRYDRSGPRASAAARRRPVRRRRRLGDIFEAFFGGGSPFGGGAVGRRRPDRRGGRPRGRRRPRLRGGRVRRRDAGRRCAPRSPATTCEATGAAPGTEPVDLLRVRRRRPGAPGAPVDPRPDGHRRPVPPLRRARARSSTSPCPECRGEGRAIEERTYTVDVPAGVDTGSTLRLAGRGAVGPRAARAGDLYVHLRVRAARALRARRRRPRHELHVPFTQAALGADARRSRRSTAPRTSTIPPGTAAGHGVPPARAAACPTSSGRGRGDLLVQVVVDTPDRARRRGGGARCASSPSCAARTWRRRRDGLPVQDPLRVQVAGERAVAAELTPLGDARPRLRRRPRRARARPTTTATTSRGCCALRPGDPVTVSRRRGAVAAVPARAGDRSRPTGDVVADPRARARRSPSAFALVKGERPEWSVQKLTELGVDRIVPFVAERSVVRWDAEPRPARQRRAAGRRRPGGGDAEPPVLAARGRRRSRPSPRSPRCPGAALADARRGRRRRSTTRSLLVGPEGGWSPTRAWRRRCPRCGSGPTSCGPRPRRSPPVRCWRRCVSERPSGHRVDRGTALRVIVGRRTVDAQ